MIAFSFIYKQDSKLFGKGPTGIKVLIILCINASDITTVTTARFLCKGILLGDR